ncbi:hypothetical protein SPMLV016_A0206, partial [Streptococcus pneumoniae MLV-016]
MFDIFNGLSSRQLHNCLQFRIQVFKDLTHTDT